MWSNCLLWALREFWRHGGHLTMCKSKHGWWPHFGVIRNGEMRYFYPTRPERYRRWRFPPPLFRGHVRSGDYLG